MEISSLKKGSINVVTVKGALDAASTNQFREYVAPLFAESGQRIVVDLSNVDFIDSSGLGALVGMFKRARIGEGELKLAGAQPPIMRIFELTHLDKVFTLVSNVEDAVA